MPTATFNSPVFNAIPFNAPGDALQILAPTQVICIDATAQWETELSATAQWEIEIAGEVPDC